MSDPQLVEVGSLKAVAFSPESPQWLVVLCHGYGAPGTDLAGLAEPLIDAMPSLGTCCEFLFPAAPNDLASLGMPGGRAWWPINMQRLLALTESGSLLELIDETPPGLKEAADILHEAVQARLKQLNLGPDRLILGGFSQGAMLTTHLTLTGRLTPRLLTILSGALICRPEWTESLQKQPELGKKLSVFQSHGKYDSILPMAGAQMLAALLETHEIPLDFWSFAGEHGIPGSVVSELAKRLGQICQE